MTRLCLIGGCNQRAIHRGRCEAHRRSTTQRGYGAQHQAARERLAGTLPRYCGYGCGRWLTRTSSWVAAHVRDGDPAAGYLVSCASCNERAKGGGMPYPGGEGRTGDLTTLPDDPRTFLAVRTGPRFASES